MKLKGALFDLDGVITQTAALHGKAWKRMFDGFINEISKDNDRDISIVPFTHDDDYLPFIDGKPRLEGIRSWLESRKIEIPEGTPEDTVENNTVQGLGKRKNNVFLELLKNEGVQTYESTIALIDEMKNANLALGVASSSRNCTMILKNLGIIGDFGTVVDGVVLQDLGLTGKPAPDIFLQAARNLNLEPSETVVFEDAVSGVQAAVAGKFGLVVGISRGEANKEDLVSAGANVVYSDLSDTNLKLLASMF